MSVWIVGFFSLIYSLLEECKAKLEIKRMSWKNENTQDDGPWGRPRGSGGSDGPPQNPWKRKSGPGGGNDNIDEMINKFQKRFKDMMSNNGSKGGNGKIFMVILGIALLIWVSTGFYRVQEGEVGVVLRFGEMVRLESAAGLRYHIPIPIEEVIVQKVAAVSRIDGGIKTGAGRPSTETNDQAVILTGDENMVLTSYTVLWKIKDVSDYLFTARNPDSLIEAAAESCIREVIGQTTARLALTEGRDTISTKAQELLQALMDFYKLGVQIISVQLQKVDPPVQVIDAFNDVQASLVDADRLRNEAEAYRNDIIPRARGMASKNVQDAEAYSQQIVAQAEGEAAQFNKVYEEFRQNPKVTKNRYYINTMQGILSKLKKIIIDPKIGKSVLPYLPLPGLHSETPATQEKQKGE